MSIDKKDEPGGQVPQAVPHRLRLGLDRLGVVVQAEQRGPDVQAGGDVAPSAIATASWISTTPRSRSGPAPIWAKTALSSLERPL